MSKYLDPQFWLHLLDKLLKRPQANNGFIPYEPSDLDEIHYKGKDEVLGNTKVVLRQDSQWLAFRPIGEKQQRNVTETMSCVSFSACNVIEEIVLCMNKMVEMGIADEEQKGIIEVFKHFGILRKDGEWRANSSDRYVAKLSGTSRRGNSQKAVANAIRKYGLVAETDWAWVDGWNNYFRGIPQSVIDKGKRLAEYIDFNYEWSNPALYQDALKYAPLQTSVFAWGGKQNGLYYRMNYRKNHATIRDGYDTESIKVNDSYEPFSKETTLDFNFGHDMIFTLHLKKKLTKYNEIELKKLLDKGVKYILLVEDCDGYTRGLWQITEKELVKIEANQVPEQPRNNAFIIKSAEDGSLIPYAPINFEKLIT